MRKRLGTTILLLALAAGAVEARDTGQTTTRLKPFQRAAGTETGTTSSVSHLSAFGGVDTMYYGGTFWASDSARWEAVRDSCWTFDTGVGSAFGATGPNKPVGYHTRMEGWYGRDATLNPIPYFRRSSTCVIAGSFSFWAGVNAAEATGLCWAAGQGYGNNWDLTIAKTFNYPGSGNITLSYKYAVDAEPGYDYMYVLVDTTGNGSQDDLVLNSYTGTVSGTGSVILNPGSDLRSNAGPITIKFVASSDGSYSDEDGLNPTSCGHSAIDDIGLTGAVVDNSNFESGANGWVQVIPTTGIGDFSNLGSLADLPPPATFCPCAMSDSVLVFFDTNDSHPLDQLNFAVSPWIDLGRGGDAGRPGKLLTADVYSEMPAANYVFEYQQIRWFPYTCPQNGQIITSPWRDQNTVFYYGETPFCTQTGAPAFTDYSGIVDAAAQEVQLSWGVINLCRTAPFGFACTGQTNTTPYLDNLALGVYGEANAPTVIITTFEILQDNFAADGTLNPAATGVLDVNNIISAGAPEAGATLGDTLTVTGDGGNTEVRLVFHVRPGPFTNAGSLASRATRWRPEPGLGSNWYSARMDSAERGGINIPTTWMATFHESDPGFQGTDTTPDAGNPNQLANEIIPDNLFTPGSRIEYFIASRYLPGDPRNPGGTNWTTNPDTAGRTYFEVEILPSSMAADSSWNCTLYVDHHHDREVADQNIITAGLNASLGLGGNNAEGTRFDRFDNEAPSSNQVSFGRPLDTNWGASIIQVFGYKNILWFTGTLNGEQITQEDAAILNPWLLIRAIGNNRFYGSGDDLATAMHLSGKAGPTQFLRNTMGALRNCNTIRNAACPTGTVVDSTFCLPVSAVAGSHFPLAGTNRIRGNGCPNLRSYDLLSVNPAVTTARGNINYVKSGVDRNYASITNWNTVDVDYKTVLDGFQVGRLRSNAGFFGVGCDQVAAAHNRLDAILDWFGTAATCKVPAALVDVPVDGGPGVPGFRHALGNAYPNPMNPTTRIQFTNGVANGRVKLEIFDISGRLVRTLVDDRMSAGVHEVTWDGMAQKGNPVPSGMYFYRMTADDFVSAKKLVVSK
ncbi:MAG TPA: FlgD immunoglobulin-like domain containing protein [Candidatus Eisenbacteria bacterium]